MERRGDDADCEVNVSRRGFKRDRLRQPGRVVGTMVDTEADAQPVAAVVDDDVVRGEPRGDRSGGLRAKGEKASAPAFIPSR